MTEKIKNACGKPQVYDQVPADVVERIEEMIKDNKRILFMKGNPAQPMCRFSAQVVQILNHYGKEFGSFNILADPEVRFGLKVYSDWPTFPQLYVNGKMIGGCDVIADLHEDGELEQELD